ncbi:hypothetical protein [Pyrobaculum ferrireducens]|uniref:Uncharacterized protein n=1 Tax=Pyrobaculum ferrireducens TaxID=1104324 RepID=G7VDM4_9CREN|nr:hypothetical protein [Pyrobaculum ferrireducens]AET34003.1 hypothetical protein P186_2619 [Pyrobaculum ferrireducens]
MRRALRFYDIAAGRGFYSTSYRLVEVEIRYRRGVVKRQLAVAISPYTGHECYSFAPRRSEVKSLPLTLFTKGDKI